MSVTLIKTDFFQKQKRKCNAIITATINKICKDPQTTVIENLTIISSNTSAPHMHNSCSFKGKCV